MSVIGSFILPHPPLIVPKIGQGQEKQIQSTIDAYEKAAHQIAAAKPETIVVISPHLIMYEDYIHISPGHGAKGNFGDFGIPSVSFEKNYDAAFIETLSQLSKKAGIPAGTLGEHKKNLDHGVMVPLYFIDHYDQSYQLVRISISGLPFLTHYNFGKIIAKTAETLNRQVFIIASGDLSHKLKPDGPYGFAPEGPEFDKQLVESMISGDFLRFLHFNEDFCDAAGECGLRSFIEMAGALDGKSVISDFSSYEGPFGVGYAVCGYRPTGEDENRRFGEIFQAEQQKLLTCIQNNEDDYVRLARASLETYIKTGNFLKHPDKLSNTMQKNRAGVFVSLKKDGRLRGCIGTIAPVADSIADEIIANAVSAGVNDPRFQPVTREELPFLVYSVDVLSPPEPISSMDELDVKRYGVIVTNGSRRGLLLPNLEGVTTPNQQVSIALQKADISSSEEYAMERFEVVRHL